MAQWSKDNQPKKRTPRGPADKSFKLIKSAEPQIIRAVIDKALDGDMTAAGLLLKRVMPEVKSVATGAELEQIIANTELTRLKAKEISELEERLAAIEESLNVK